MTQFFTYRSPTIGGTPGWSEGLGNDTVRLASIAGIGQEAQLGAVAISSIQLDDPDADVGHSGDAIVGLKQFDWTETACPVGRRRIWTGYIGDRRYHRGDDSRRSLILDSARVIDASLVDINAFLSFRRFTPEDLDETSSFNRPAETDVARVTALLAVDFLSATLFDGLVASTDTVDMDAADYTGQSPADVLNDCAQQSGKNYFVFYDEAGTYTPHAGDFALFYDFNTSAAYPANCSFSSVLADIDNVTVFGPAMNAELRRDPSRIRSEVIMAYDGGTVRRTEDNVSLTTSETYGWRTEYVSATNVKTAAKASARADRYLRESSTEDDLVTFTVFLPAAKVNEWLPGQTGDITIPHLPGYETATAMRCVKRTVKQVEDTPDWYTVDYEMSSGGEPPAGEPSGAMAFYSSGYPEAATPTLPTATTPGNLLVACITANSPSDEPAFYDPPSGGALQTWTKMGWVNAYSGTQFGGPGNRVYVGIFHRRVAVGEVTTEPVMVTFLHPLTEYGVWLWEIDTATDPTLVTTNTTDDDVPAYLVNPGTFTIGSSQTGFVLGIFGIQHTRYGGGFSITPAAGITTLTSAQASNNPATLQAPLRGGVLKGQWTFIAYRTGTGTISATITHTPGSNDDPYNHMGVAGVAIVIPGISTLPPIPYPANQS